MARISLRSTPLAVSRILQLSTRTLPTAPTFFRTPTFTLPTRFFAYIIDPTTGAVSPASSPMVAAGYRPYPVATTPTGRFVYVLNLQGNNFDPNSSNIQHTGLTDRAVP